MTIASDVSALLRCPGRLCVAPTSLAGAFPGGGTSLGLVSEIEIEIEAFFEQVSEEAFGRRVPLDFLGLGEKWTVRTKIRAPEQGKLAAFFTSSEPGTVTSETGIVYPGVVGQSGSSSPGRWLGERAVKLCFWPDDVAQWFLYMPRAIPVPQTPAQIAAAIDREGGVPVEFIATPPASGEAVQWRPLADVVLA